MNKVPVVTALKRTNDSDLDWWPNDDASSSSLPLDGRDGGLFAGEFVPPPPRPLFLDEAATPDGLTTCDLCTWSWKSVNSQILENTRESNGEISWVITLIIVSLISAVIGAIVMIIVLQCKRIKNYGSNLNESERNIGHMNPASRPPISTPDDKSLSAITPASFNNALNMSSSNGVWSWLSRRTTATPTQLANPSTSPAENHYTHMEDTYNSVGEALYAELDRESSTGGERDTNSPSYQNSAYTDPDAPASSAPSSAYYSDLSITDRPYEVVGLVTMPQWDQTSRNCNNNPEIRRQGGLRLEAISESVSFPSDYV